MLKLKSADHWLHNQTVLRGCHVWNSGTISTEEEFMNHMIIKHTLLLLLTSLCAMYVFSKMSAKNSKNVIKVAQL